MHNIPHKQNKWQPNDESPLAEYLLRNHSKRDYMSYAHY